MSGSFQQLIYVVLVVGGVSAAYTDREDAERHCKRIMTIQQDHSSITIIGAEDEPGRKVGIQSIEGDIFTARRLLEAVTFAWPFEMVSTENCTIGPRQHP
jgi:hypothetical protein